MIFVNLIGSIFFIPPSPSNLTTTFIVPSLILFSLSSLRFLQCWMFLFPFFPFPTFSHSFIPASSSSLHTILLLSLSVSFPAIIPQACKELFWGIVPDLYRPSINSPNPSSSHLYLLSSQYLNFTVLSLPHVCVYLIPRYSRTRASADWSANTTRPNSAPCDTFVWVSAKFGKAPKQHVVWNRV